MAEITEIKSEAPNPYECPVCMEQLLPPIYQCYSGHTLCNECEADIKSCPICRDDLPKEKKIRNRMLEEVIQELNIECENIGQGCLETFKYSEREEHAWNCLYAKLPICSHLGLTCDSQQSLTSILNHCESEHGLRGFNFDESTNNIKNSESQSNFIEIEQSLSPGKLESGRKSIPEWKPIYFTYKKRHFFLTTKYSKKEDCVKWTALILGSKKVSQDFLARIKFISGGSQHTFLEWQSPVSDLKSHSGSQDNKKRQQKPKLKSSAVATFEISLQNLKALCSPKITQGKENEKVKPKGQTAETEEIYWKMHLRFLQINSNGNSSASTVAIEKPAGTLKDDVTYTDKIKEKKEDKKHDSKDKEKRNSKREKKRNQSQNSIEVENQDKTQKEIAKKEQKQKDAIEKNKLKEKMDAEKNKSKEKMDAEKNKLKEKMDSEKNARKKANKTPKEKLILKENQNSKEAKNTIKIKSKNSKETDDFLEFPPEPIAVASTTPIKKTEEYDRPASLNPYFGNSAASFAPQSEEASHSHHAYPTSLQNQQNYWGSSFEYPSIATATATPAAFLDSPQGNQNFPGNYSLNPVASTHDFSINCNHPHQQQHPHQQVGFPQNQGQNMYQNHHAASFYVPHNPYMQPKDNYTHPLIDKGGKK